MLHILRIPCAGNLPVRMGQYCWVLILTLLLTSTAFNLLWPSDAIWWNRTGSTLVQVMACCLTAPSHYLSQCWFIISKVPWHSSEDIIKREYEWTSHSSLLRCFLTSMTVPIIKTRQSHSGLIFTMAITTSGMLAFTLKQVPGAKRVIYSIHNSESQMNHS